MIIAQITKVAPQRSQENLKNQIKWVLLGSQLIIGDFMDHTYLVMEALHPDLGFDEAMKKVDSYNSQVAAAGIANKDGSMDCWKSTGFCVETPWHLKEELASAIREIVVSESNWKQPLPSAL